MKKIFVSISLIVAFVLYGIFHNKTATTTALPVIATPSSSSSNSSSSTVSSASGYKDGTFTGSVADAYYGNIQIQATIRGGRIINIQFLQYPNDRRRSIEINQYADPILAQEAIQAQNVHVDIVSGATDTSEAFIQSLTSALDQAKS